MIRLRHILHPIRSAKSLYRGMSTDFYRRLAERQFRTILRGHRDGCWCGGELLPFKWHPSYGVCRNCGSYVNRRPPVPEELKRLYSFDLYWHTRQQLKGYPAIEHRPVNDRSDGRVGRWLAVIEQHGPRKGQVIEVGCAHGVLLAELKERGYDCVGVEVDEKVAAWTRKNTGVDIRVGFFPGVELPSCDLFMAFDVIEHSPCPDEFLREAARLLGPSGIAIIQTPIDRHACEPPFPDIFDNLFDDVEHLYIFTSESIRHLAKIAGLEVIAEARGVIDFDITVFRRKD